MRAPRHTDLRLAGLAGAVWLAALAALHLSAPAATLIAGLAALAAGGITVVLHAARRRVRPPSFTPYGWIAVAVLLGAVCGAGATAARLSVRDAPEIRGLAERRAQVTATLVVRDDPRPVPGGIGGRQLLLVHTDLLRLGEPERPAVVAPARLLVLADDPAWRRLLPGQHLVAEGRLAMPRGGDLTAAVLSASGAPELVGRSSWAQRGADVLRDGLQGAAEPLPDEPGGLLPGLVVGDTSRLLATVEEDFRATGLTHLVAVSGSNVAIVVGFVLLIARWARLGPVVAAAACVVALVGFVILVRPSPSVVRAATMGVIGLAALAAGRPRAALPALCTAVAVLVVADPALAGDPGFALSVLATAGLLLLAPGWRDALRRRGVPAGLAEALAIPASAQVACAPVVAALSGTVSLVAVPANLAAVVAIAPATILGVAAAVVSPIWAPGAEFAAWLAGWPAWWLVLVARTGAQVPAGTLPWPSGLAGALLLATLTVVMLLGARRPTIRRLILVIGTAVAIGALPVRFAAGGWPPKGWLVVACSVGQGDALVLPAGAGRAVVVDAGPEPAPVDRCLRRLAIREVPLLVLSHLHADHVGGVAGVLRGRRVDTVMLPGHVEPTTAYGDVVAAATKARAAVRVASAGAAFHIGELEVLALGPTHALRGTRSDPNNNSLVLRARIRGIGILLPGDAEEEQQRDLLDRYGPAALRVDVLKVPHHGSAYQDQAFLDAVDARVALVSAGVGNRYGHPNPGLLGRLAGDGARVLRTDEQGDVAVVEAEEGLAVIVRGPDPGERRPQHRPASGAAGNLARGVRATGARSHPDERSTGRDTRQLPGLAPADRPAPALRRRAGSCNDGRRACRSRPCRACARR